MELAITRRMAKEGEKSDDEMDTTDGMDTLRASDPKAKVELASTVTIAEILEAQKSDRYCLEVWTGKPGLGSTFVDTDDGAIRRKAEDVELQMFLPDELRARAQPLTLLVVERKSGENPRVPNHAEEVVLAPDAWGHRSYSAKLQRVREE